MKTTYTFERSFSGKYSDYQFPQKEKDLLQPMAETLAMLDGNAFLTVELVDGRLWWEQYLPEAKELFEANGGMDGWAGEASFAKNNSEKGV